MILRHFEDEMEKIAAFAGITGGVLAASGTSKDESRLKNSILAGSLGGTLDVVLAGAEEDKLGDRRLSGIRDLEKHRHKNTKAMRKAYSQSIDKVIAMRKKEFQEYRDSIQKKYLGGRVSKAFRNLKGNGDRDRLYTTAWKNERIQNAEALYKGLIEDDKKYADEWFKPRIRELEDKASRSLADFDRDIYPEMLKGKNKIVRRNRKLMVGAGTTIGLAGLLRKRLQEKNR